MSDSLSIALPTYNPDLTALPDRVANYLAAQRGEIDAPYLLPLSCSLFIPQTLADVLKAAIWIKRGAGVKVILPGHLLGGFTTGSSGRILAAQDSLLTDPSLEGDFGILECLRRKIEFGDGIVFRNLRPKGAECKGGLKASGPESFGKIAGAIDAYRFDPTLFNLLTLLGTINEVMVQGGFKKGIITVSLPASSPMLGEYLSIPLEQIPGSLKREVRFEDERGSGRLGYLEQWGSLPQHLKQAILDARNFTSLMLAKERVDQEGVRIYSNVCEGIYLRDGGTCLIARVPLHRIPLERWSDAFLATYEFAEALWEYWHSQADGGLEYPFNPRESDRQIALDVMGLANALAMHRVTYREFNDALETLLTNPRSRKKGGAFDLARAIVKAYRDCAKVIAQRGKFHRVFTVEPQQAHAFREKDPRGYTAARGIWPVWDRWVERRSDHGDTGVYQYPAFEVLNGNPDLAQETYRLNQLWQRLLDSTGFAHSISTDVFHEMTLEGIEEWLLGPLHTLYYQFHREGSQQVKKTVEVDVAGLSELISTPACDLTAKYGCSSCGA